MSSALASAESVRRNNEFTATNKVLAMSVRWILLVSLVLIEFPRTIQAQQYADRGAVVGGVTGALAGAGIGKHNGETAAGALLGGAVGLVTGAAVGHSMDNRNAQQVAKRQYVQQQQARQYQRAVSPYDVIRMSQSGVGQEVMINQIRQRGVQGEMDVQDVIALHKQGVPESVISAMQRAANALPEEAVYVAPAGTPVVVEQYHYVAPAPYWGPPVYHVYPSHRHYHRPGASWGVRYSN